MLITSKRSPYILLGVGLLALVVSFGAVAKANPSLFLLGQLSSSSSTVTYLTPGTASTTIGSLSSSGTSLGYFDLGAGGAQGADSAILALQFTGSSTPNNSAIATTTFNVSIEYSQDRSDWYGDSYDGFATSTVTQNRSANTVYKFTLGTQLLSGNVVASTTPTKFLINIPTPTRYVRAIVTIPTGTGSTNGAVWGQFIAKRQAP